MSETKLVRIYPEDLERLSQYLSLLQLARKKRFSFAEVIHEVLTAVDHDKAAELKEEMANQQVRS